MRIREMRREEVGSRLRGVDPDRIVKALALDDGEGEIALVGDAFDSEIFGLTIGRIIHLEAPSVTSCGALVHALVSHVRALSFDQILRRVGVGRLQEVWSLEAAGFRIMDVGVTFGRILRGPTVASRYDDLVVRPSTDDDMVQIVDTMVERPWGSRYESDPAYRPEQVKELRSRWLWNSHRGRAEVVLVGVMDGEPAGYVTCLVDPDSRVGEIELVGTLPAFRRRRVAFRILEHAVEWFSTRVGRVTVRTQATNFAAANLYEKAGFTLYDSDLTLRLAVGDLLEEAL
jgi:GNAT superfamily N-acetyltransferase